VLFRSAPVAPQLARDGVRDLGQLPLLMHAVGARPIRGPGLDRGPRHGLAGRRYGPGPPRDLEGVGGVHGEALWSRTCARLSINAGGQETSLLNLPSHST